MGDVSGVLHRVVDAAHLFQVRIDTFDEKIRRNEFSDAKLILNQLEQFLSFLFNPLNPVNIDDISVTYDSKSECSNYELRDLVEEFISTSTESDLPGVCLFVFAELYNKRVRQFQERLLNHTVSQFKSAFINPKFNVNDLRDLTLIGNSSYLSKSVRCLEKVLAIQLSIFESKSVNKSDVIKSGDLNKCKIDQFLDVVGILKQLDLGFSKDLIYYAFQIICKNLISEFDHSEAGAIIDEKIPKNLHFDPNIEFARIANENMSFHYITIAAKFFESRQGFSVPLTFTDNLSGFSELVDKLISDCEGLSDHEFNMRVRMIMACICAYSSSFGRLISENRDNIDRLMYIFTILTIIKTEISKMVVRVEFKPIIASLDFSQSVAELAMKEILRKINNELGSDINTVYSICQDLIIRLSGYPTLPSFNRLFNFIVDVVHFNLIRYVYKSLENGCDIDDLLDNCQKITDLISENKPPLGIFI